jgi:hypothetical protein
VVTQGDFSTHLDQLEQVLTTSENAIILKWYARV